MYASIATLFVEAMGDNIDRAHNEIDRSLSEALRLRKPEAPISPGKCIWCEAKTSNEARWCDSFCREDWEWHEKHLAKTIAKRSK